MIKCLNHKLTYAHNFFFFFFFFFQWLQVIESWGPSSAKLRLDLNKNSTSTFLPVLLGRKPAALPNDKPRDCRHGNMNEEFVSPFPSCWAGQKQTLNPKIRMLSSSALWLQPNEKTKGLHKLELLLACGTQAASHFSSTHHINNQWQERKLWGAFLESSERRKPWSV